MQADMGEARTGRFYRTFGKRIFDIVIALTAMIVLAPLLAILAVAVRICLGSPVLFRHRRPGLGGEPFVLLKFRTMTDRRDETGRLLPDRERGTKFGNFLRASSLDELPELWNVLRGEMSLVGPRPLMMQYLPRYTPRQMRRHETKPGITGLAQVNGRNLLCWEQKFEMDVDYVDRCSLRLDLEILARTVRAVLLREGIAAPAHFSAPEFMGSGREAAESKSERRQ